MGTSTSETTRQADTLMSSGHTSEAKQLLLDAIAQNPQDKGLYADSVAIFISGGLFAEAKDLFRKYNELTGGNLEGWGGSDFTLQDIDQMAAKAALDNVSNVNGGVVFNAFPLISFRNQGIGMNLWSHISGITKLAIYSDHLEVTRRSQVLSYPWSVLTAEVATKASYPRGILINRITIYAPDRVFRLKTIPNAPQYFENEGKLLPELRKYLAFTDKP